MLRIPMGVMSALLVSAVAAAEVPAMSTAALPVPASAISAALGMPAADATTVLLEAIRLTYLVPDTREGQRARAQQALERLLAGPAQPGADVVPLPLGGAVWRQRILQADIPDDRLVAAILGDRTAAALYLGLVAVDDETLRWIAENPETLSPMRRHPAIVAAFARSLRIRDGRVAVPAGPAAEGLWKAAIGADPARPAVFVPRVLSTGRLALFYDTIAHLDDAHQRFALGLALPASARADRFRDLLRAFETAAPDWNVEERPFARPIVDGAMLFSAVGVLETGALAPPADRQLWARVFRADTLTDIPFERVSMSQIGGVSRYLTIDAAYLATRILSEPYAIGRRRLDLLLLGQRVFGTQQQANPALLATAVRTYLSFPALVTAIERIGTTNPAIYVEAAAHAAKLNAIDALPVRAASIAQFQSAIVMIQRARWTHIIALATAERLITQLAGLDVSARDGYGVRFSRWLQDDLIAAFKPIPGQSIEDTLLAAFAGVRSQRPAPTRIEWEGRPYLVDPATAELRRLRRVRRAQGGLSLDDALGAVNAKPENGRGPREAERSLADVLVSIVYALSLGEPDGLAVTSGNVAARHDFGLVATPPSSAAAWRLAIEDFDRKAWHLQGALFGLEAPLGRLALRRVNAGEMPAEPKVGPQDRQTAMLTVALLNGFALSDASRDDIAAAVRRGRARAEALPRNAATIDQVARDAGLSEWRRRALQWALTQGAEDVTGRFSLLELFWLGAPRTEEAAAIDGWGAAMLPRSGCLCLQMPGPRPWEEDAGYASALLGSRAADVNLRIAITLADLGLPAALAPALAGYVMQDVLEHAQLSNPDDWNEFGRAARELPRDRMLDYIAALTAGGPLLPITDDASDKSHP